MADGKYESQRITTAVRLPKDLYKQLKHEAIDRECSVNSLIEEACVAYLNKEKAPPKRGRLAG